MQIQRLGNRYKKIDAKCKFRFRTYQNDIKKTNHKLTSSSESLEVDGSGTLSISVNLDDEAEGQAVGAGKGIEFGPETEPFPTKRASSFAILVGKELSD